MIIFVVVFKRFTTVRWLRLARSSVNHSEVGSYWWRWFVCFFFTCVLSFRLYCFSCLFFYLPVAFDFFSLSFGLRKVCLTGRRNEANVATAQAIKCLHGMLLYQASGPKQRKEQNRNVLYYIPSFMSPSEPSPSPNSRTFFLWAGVVFFLFGPPPHC